jgi:hypothetical protein
MIINKEKALNLIQKHGETIFGVKFIKENGELRSMSCRLHATNKAIEANRTGRKNSPNRDRFKVRVYDMGIKTEEGQGAFRTISVDRLLSLTIAGENYRIDFGT